MQKEIKIFLTIMLLIIVMLFTIRLLSPREIDDVSPGIFCESEYLNKSDVLWVVPMFDNKLVSENKTWCNYILNLNKTLGLHGVYHTYNEFREDRDGEYLKDGIEAFERCFGYKPELFKPPQLRISKRNKELIRQSNLKLKTQPNQLIHKVYHCNNTGIFPNWFIDLF